MPFSGFHGLSLGRYQGKHLPAIKRGNGESLNEVAVDSWENDAEMMDFPVSHV